MPTTEFFREPTAECFHHHCCWGRPRPPHPGVVSGIQTACETISWSQIFVNTGVLKGVDWGIIRRDTNHGVRLSPSFDSNLLRHGRIKLSLAQNLREVGRSQQDLKKWGPRGSLILLSTLTFCGAAQVVRGMLQCVSLIEVWLQFCTATYSRFFLADAPLLCYLTGLNMRLRARTTVLRQNNPRETYTTVVCMTSTTKIGCLCLVSHALEPLIMYSTAPSSSAPHSCPCKYSEPGGVDMITPRQSDSDGRCTTRI